MSPEEAAGAQIDVAERKVLNVRLPQRQQPRSRICVESPIDAVNLRCCVVHIGKLAHTRQSRVLDESRVVDGDLSPPHVEICPPTKARTLARKTRNARIQPNALLEVCVVEAQYTRADNRSNRDTRSEYSSIECRVPQEPRPIETGIVCELRKAEVGVAGESRTVEVGEVGELRTVEVGVAGELRTVEVGGSGELRTVEAGVVGELRIVEVGVPGEPRTDKVGEAGELRLSKSASPENCARLKSA